MTHRSFFVSLALWFGAGYSGAASAGFADGIDPEAIEKLSDLVAYFVEQQEIVGAELLVMQSGRPLLHEAFGWKDLEKRVPMGRNTLFAARSMTKPITGTAVLKLSEAGRLNLDDPVSNYLTCFDNAHCKAITIRHLLTHRSGLPLQVLHEKGLTVRDVSSLEEIACLAASHGPVFSPGSRFLYSDSGADVLDAIVERVSGQQLSDFVQTRILDMMPLSSRETGRVSSALRCVAEMTCRGLPGSSQTLTRRPWTKS